MSWGSLNVAGAALGAAFSLLLCASIIQGFSHDVERARYETTEAVEGQNVTLDCTIETLPDLKIVNIEWRKKNNKLALFSPGHGEHLFWPNITLHIEKANNSMGYSLHLPQVKKWDSGIYICDIASFPIGSIRRETELKIKEAEIMCNMDSSFQVSNGQNVTIRCQTTFPNARYRWTKNEELVSDSASLQLLWVTDAHAGVYTLTVNTGSETVHKAFTIAVQAATTQSDTDPTTVSLRPDGTKQSFSVPADKSFPTPQTTGLLTTDANLTWTTANGDHPDVITAGEDVTSVTSPAHFSVTTSAVETDPPRSASLSPASAAFTPTQNLTTAEEHGNPSMSSVGPQVWSSTSGNITERYERPAANPTRDAGNNGPVEDSALSYLAVFVIVPVLVLIAWAGCVYRRRMIEQRMDLPPPFKPPPPPVKYTSATHREIYARTLPVSRCNSVTELDQMFVPM